MDANKADEKSFWSSGFSAKLYRKFAKNHYLKMHEKVVELIAPKNPQNLLDIACGPGYFLSHLAKALPQLQLTGSDIAPGMVEFARQRLQDKAQVFEVTADRQPFNDRSFDVVTLMLAFHHIEDKAGTLREVSRLLKPHGVFVVADLVADNNFQKKLWNIVERMTGVKGYIGHYTKAELEPLAKQEGFKLEWYNIKDMAKRYKICFLEKELDNT